MITIDHYHQFELYLTNLTNLLNDQTYHLGKTKLAPYRFILAFNLRSISWFHVNGFHVRWFRVNGFRGADTTGRLVDGSCVPVLRVVNNLDIACLYVWVG